MLTSPLITPPFSIRNAYLEHDTTILVKLSDPLAFPLDASDLTVTDTSADKTIAVLKVDLPQASSAVSFATASQSSAEPGERGPAASVSRGTDLLEVTLAEAPDVAHRLYIALKGSTPVRVTPRNVLNAGKYLYQGNDLGSIYQPEVTSFRLWAPTASDVQLLLYESDSGPLQRQVAMLPSDNGTWSAQVSGDLQNWVLLMCNSSRCRHLPASMRLIQASTTGAMIPTISMCQQGPMRPRLMEQLGLLNASK